MACAAELVERVEFRWPWPGEQSVPGVRADPGHEGESSGRYPESHGALESGEIGEEVPCDLLAPRLDRRHKEERGRGERGEHGLGLLEPDRRARICR